MLIKYIIYQKNLVYFVVFLYNFIGDIMSKAEEYNDKFIKDQQKKVKRCINKYYKNECNYQTLNKENRLLVEKYINLEKIIDMELNNSK